ncbi:sodium-dependent bicarbonate transport family permease [Paenibacillus chartarius]|uniref:Sodium-dependent bicarbonate transport family permease n=1 Tax=Paenibacillus chartarius TaxID=747481 RepID=A0ABV6DP85_9BACL
MTDIIMQNLLSPVVLFFILGLVAAIFKSDLKFPSGLSEALSIYLLIAIGMKGGIELSHYSVTAIIRPLLGTLFLGVFIPVLTLAILRMMKLDLKNSIALAATYGSVSIVTYGAAVSFLDGHEIQYDGFMNAMVVLLESPAILVSLLLLKAIENNTQSIKTPYRLGIMDGFVSSLGAMLDRKVLKESLVGKSVLLLMGSLAIGVIIGEDGLPVVKPLFIELYSGVLMLFLLNMGLVAGQRLPEIRRHGFKLLLFAILMPLLCGSAGVIVGGLAGLSLGSATLLGVMAGSSSYIAAPAALRSSVPEANPSIYLGLSLGITFPFNLILGIPLYYQIAQWTL